MKPIVRTWWIILALVSLAWFVAERDMFTNPGSLRLRPLLLQYSGVLAIVWMSVAMILATRPRRPEHWFGGLDKMYRLHKWVGISAFVLSVGHWPARIRDTVPSRRKSTVWFCGPIELGDALRNDFARSGFAVDEKFRQELFAMR